MNLYTLATTKNVDLNYQSFKKRELIECLSSLRTTYFSLKEQNQKYKEVFDKLNELIEKNYFKQSDDYYDYFTEGVVLQDGEYEELEDILNILKEVE